MRRKFVLVVNVNAAEERALAKGMCAFRAPTTPFPGNSGCCTQFPDPDGANVTHPNFSGLDRASTVTTSDVFARADPNSAD